MRLIDAEQSRTGSTSHGPGDRSLRAAAPATRRRASPPSAAAPPSSARSPTTSSATSTATTCTRSASISTPRRSRTATPTARSMILITPDGERTMNTYLGACQQLLAGRHRRPDGGARRRSPIWRAISGIRRRRRRPFARRPRSPTAPAARWRSRCRDSFCVDRFRDEFIELMRDATVDIVFANEYGAALALRDGRFRHGGRGRPPRRQARRALPSAPRARWWSSAGGRSRRCRRRRSRRSSILTGAGDLFAAGFLFGFASGMPLRDVCGELGTLAAAEVISHIGPRPATLAPRRWPARRACARSDGRGSPRGRRAGRAALSACRRGAAGRAQTKSTGSMRSGGKPPLRLASEMICRAKGKRSRGHSIMISGSHAPAECW